MLTHLQLQGGLLVLHHTRQVQVLFLDAQGYRYLVDILVSWHEAHAEHHWRKKRGLVFRDAQQGRVGPTTGPQAQGLSNLAFSVRTFL